MERAYATDKEEINMPAFRYKWYVYFLLFTPLASLLAMTLIPATLGCSEYRDQISATCESLGNHLDVNISDALMLPALIAWYATLVSVPIGASLLIVKYFINSHRKSSDGTTTVRE
jgi:hypothetical protein